MNSSSLGLGNAPQHARDLWVRQDVKLNGAEYSAVVRGHGVVMLRVSRKQHQVADVSAVELLA